MNNHDSINCKCKLDRDLSDIRCAFRKKIKTMQKWDKLAAKSIEHYHKHLKMQKWDKWTLPTYKSITLWESAIS